MEVTIPDSLREFVDQQVRCGSYANADAFVADLVRAEAEMAQRIGRGEALPVDEHFTRRLEMLLDEAEQGGDYVEVSSSDFDAMEREALDQTRQHQGLRG